MRVVVAVLAEEGVVELEEAMEQVEVLVVAVLD